MTQNPKERGRRAQHPEEPQRPRREPAANVEQIGEWFTKTVQKEQEEQEGKPKAFEPGEEGIEEVLGE